MKLVVDTNTQEIYFIGQKADVVANGIDVGSTIYANTGQYAVVDVGTIPNDVAVNKSCYDATKGFYPNPNYIPPVDDTIRDYFKTPQQKYNEVKANPGHTLADLQNAKIAWLNDQCNQAILTGFTSTALGDGTAHKYDFDYEAQANYTGTLALINAGVIASTATIPWKADGNPINHTVAQTKQLCSDGFNWKEGQINHYRTLKANVQAATTDAAVDAVTW